MCTSCTTRITRTTALFLPLEGGANKRLRSSKTTALYCCGPRLLGTGSQRQLVSSTCRQNRSFVTGGADKARQQLRGRAAVQGRSSDRGTALPPVEPSVPSAPRAREHCWTRERALERALHSFVQSWCSQWWRGAAWGGQLRAAAWQFSADQLCLCVRPAAGQEGSVLLQNLLNCQRGF